MHGTAGLVVLALLLVGVPGLFAARTVARRRARTPGARTRGGFVSGFFQRRHERRMEQARHENGMLRDKARHEQRLREQAERDRRAESRRPRGAAVPGEAEWTDAPGSGPAPERRRRSPFRPRVIRLWPEPPDAGGRAPAAGSRPDPGENAGADNRPRRFPRFRPSRPGHPDAAPDSPAAAPQAPEPPRPSGEPWSADPSRAPRPPVPQPLVRDGEGSPSPSRPAPGTSPARPPTQPQSESPILEGTVVTIMPDSPAALTVPGVEPIIDGAAALRRYAMAGNAQAKRRAVLGLVAAADCLAGTARALSREMAEPGQHYGTEITEPLAMAATHFSVAGLTLAEIDGRIAAVIRAMEELQSGGVQAPHHEQMTAQ